MMLSSAEFAPYRQAALSVEAVKRRRTASRSTRTCSERSPRDDHERGPGRRGLPS